MQLTVERVSKSFGNHIVLREVDLTVKPREIVGIVGPNGAGKTTLFNIISGFIKPDSGRVLLNGQDVTGLKPHRIRLLGLARSFQVPRPLERFTVLENVVASILYGWARKPTVSEAQAHALKVLEEVGLRDVVHQYPGSLPLAQLKKLELARTIAADPVLVLLDEVTAGLSPAERNSLIEVIRRFHQERGITIMVIDHVISTIMALCDRVVVLDKGVKIAEGGPEEVFENELVVRSYIGERRVAGAS